MSYNVKIKFIFIALEPFYFAQCSGHLSLTPKASILSLVHNKVLRLTSTASAVSGVSGFSDDFQDDDNDDGLITSAGEKKKERRDYGSISCNVYWQYIRAGGVILLAVFMALSVALQSIKVKIMRGVWKSYQKISVTTYNQSAIQPLRYFKPSISGLS